MLPAHSDHEEAFDGTIIEGERGKALVVVADAAIKRSNRAAGGIENMAGHSLN